MLLQEIYTIKIKLASLKQNFANPPSTSKPPCIVPSLRYLTHQLEHNVLLNTISLFLTLPLIPITTILSKLYLDLILPCLDRMISIMVNAFIITDIPLMPDIASQVALIIKHLKSL